VLILAILGFGMLMGWLAQLVLGMGTRPNLQSLIAGIVGSFVGGTIFSLVSHEDFGLRPSGIIGTFVGAIIVLVIWRAIEGRSSST
jgi:uncharacterized membrane protein YeaQ/YmgE (transglycosylase-associated protein family)